MDNRTTIQDRRKKPTPILSRYTLFGQRCSFRRTADQHKGGYVDRYGQGLFICLLLIAGLNILDAFFTIIILGSGGREVNPLVRWAIDSYGDNAWSLKFAVVSCGAILLCLHSHFRMAKVSIIVAAVLFSGVVMYQLLLLRYISIKTIADIRASYVKVRIFPNRFS
jgi:hypothetical protein